MERSAQEDDVKTCPLCGSREGLVIRWLPDLDYPIHKITKVGCNTCGKFFLEKEARHAIAAWNFFVVEENDRTGKKESHIELYRLLYAHSQAEKKIASLQTKIDDYLEENISPTCDLKIGDRFKIKGRPREIWSIVKVYSAYFWSTGPTWIIDAINVLSNGRLGEKHQDFLEHERAKIEPIKTFWRPTRWSQVIRGDDCLYMRQPGRIFTVDRSKRMAKIKLNNQTVQVTSLRKIYIPIQRFEST
ncbi:hypothetical protein HQ584_11755 [Patescibacteria group bacterium]|nr:hypothetical protein [Patescibacteria group bacterium]